MTAASTFRGQPLLLLGGVLAGWFGLRVAFWQPPLESPPETGRPAMAGSISNSSRMPGIGVAGEEASRANPVVEVEDNTRTGAMESLPPFRLDWPQKTVSPPLIPDVPPTSAVSFKAAPITQPEVAALPAKRASARAVVGHNLLLAAGLAEMEIPPFLLAYMQPQSAAGAMPASEPARIAEAAPRSANSGSRWSGDGWLLVRDDSITPIQAGLPSYGRSQAGAVLRYRLSAGGERSPQAHLRASGALAASREQELAAGISARVLARLPVRLAVEARVRDSGTGASVRPAAYAITELPPIELPLAARAEVYVQGGYVGGKDATAFVDGQARIERSVARPGAADVSIGTGAWGGAQEGAARFDIGPTAGLQFRVGDARGKLAADYRFRVAGDAEPKNGPALTLSAGF